VARGSRASGVCSAAGGQRRPPGGPDPGAALGQTGRVDNLLAPSDYLLTGVSLVLFGLAVWALVDAALRPAAAFPAAGKLTKPAWLAILVVCVALCVLRVNILGLLGIAVAVATILYLVDVRPAVRELGGGRGPWR